MTDINEFFQSISPDTLKGLAQQVLSVVQENDSFAEPTGVEGRVCRDITERQKKGISKYGVTVESNPLSLNQWNRHLYEELLDAAVYQRKIMEEGSKTEKMLHKIVNYAISKSPDLFLERPPSNGKDEIDSIIEWIDSILEDQVDQDIDYNWILWDKGHKPEHLSDGDIVKIKRVVDMGDPDFDGYEGCVSEFRWDKDVGCSFQKYNIAAYKLIKKGD